MVARLKDVAELAGVSVKTASNVVNEYEHVSPATRAKVQAAIEELRYRPNVSARQLKHGRAGFIALALPQLDSPYFAELGARFSAAAAKLGSLLLLDATGAEPEAERLVLNGMRSHVIDGMIFSPLAVDADEIADRADDLPLVLLGERAVPPGFDHVAVDSVAASRAMTDHLISLGRTRIAAIGRESVAGTASVRLEGYRQALASAGLPYRPELVIGVAHYDRIDGKQAMEQLLALPEPPDAVFCFNDLMAIGAVRACVEARVDVPGRIAIAGFDDIAEGRFGNPTLTTVAADLEFLAAEALRLLLARIEEPSRPAESIAVPWTLRLRESSMGR
ncbi:LacI family DNA-binding transcriptional regulator [Microlunatus parietis]|uniref:DNA-binding LacI/PurR family transcriptional regulator n=1 Tax=Microlunatus parietis TaxID=682979 RepID=A0A7Y9I9J0_9ACTN|nr:LacI family DNA-binding transcriptional regulator [Microlunatus parietis]NYE72274.1 DNA-binding LacI/PurR family transcriptional regulator [Microlunatus parietis]